MLLIDTHTYRQRVDDIKSHICIFDVYSTSICDLFVKLVFGLLPTYLFLVRGINWYVLTFLAVYLII